MVSGEIFQATLSILAGILVALLSGFVAHVRDNQRWLKEEIYRPLYNELVEAANGNLPIDENGNFWSDWEDFDHYQKSRVDGELRNNLNDYADALRRLNGKKLRLRREEEFLEKLPTDMTEHDIDGISFVHKKGGGTKSTIRLIDWLDMFGAIVVTSEDPDAMRRNLRSYSEDRGMGHERNFRIWDEKYDDWEEKLWTVVHNEDRIFENVDEYRRLREEVIPEKIVKLHSKLESRVEEGFFRAILRRLRVG